MTLKGTETLKHVHPTYKPFLNHAICNKPDQNGIQNKKVKAIWKQKILISIKPIEAAILNILSLPVIFVKPIKSPFSIFNRWINKTSMEVEMKSRKLVIVFMHT